MIWLVIGLVALGVEIVALARPQRGDTASEVIWRVLSWHPGIKLAAGAFYLWLGWHLFFGG